MPAEFAADVRAGLGVSGQKTLPCRWLYDAVGTALFQAICALPEYGLTRADGRIVREHARDIAEALPGPVLAVELGSGDCAKTRHVLVAFAGRLSGYRPVDVSGTALAACCRSLGGVARVAPVEAPYIEGLETAAAGRGPGERVLALFLGSTIGNFARHEAREFLAAVRARLLPGDALLLGTDLVKPERRLLEAYDDPAGVTAAFNLNLLGRINRELGADFDLRGFVHEARYRRTERRIEMHLRSLRAQRVCVPAAGIAVEFAEGETIWTESSHKFELEEVREMAAAAGFACAAQWVDEEWAFAESLLTVAATDPDR
jgi:L-histidine Nalpha-methyltransferase